MADARNTVTVALVGGPMYDPLYETIPAFEQASGLRVTIIRQLPHPELNAFVKRTFDAGAPAVDLLSTHTKYAPSQAPGLASLERVLTSADEADLLPRPLELSRIGGRLLQVPRNLDVRLLHYRRDLFDDPREREAFARATGRELRVPETWTELAEVASFFTRPGLCGFLFPGRDSGLFGTFYELLVGAGGALFDAALQPVFESDAGVWAAAYITDLYQIRRVTPRELPSWHYDEISAVFRAGGAAMVCDWPGSYHLYQDPATCRVSERVGLAALPSGPARIRAAYAGCHSFAVAANARNPEGAVSLLRFLTSTESQMREARGGAIPCRRSALEERRREVAGDPVEARRWELLADAEQTMIVPPRFALYPQCEDAIWHAIQGAMTGTWTPREAVARAAAAIQPIIDTQVTVES